MNLYLKIFILLIASQLFLFIAHVIILRRMTHKNLAFSPQLIVMKYAILCNLPMFLGALFLIKNSNIKTMDAVNTAFYCLIVYNCLAYTYCHFFNMGDTGRRIRILYELNIAGRLKYDDLENKYGVKNILEARLKRLVDMGQVKKLNDKFFIESKFLYYIGSIVLKWGFFLKYNLQLKEMLK